jgi:hypothetical protein
MSRLRLAILVGGLLAAAWVGAWLSRQSRLAISNEVTRVLELPYPALGAPVVAPDGRLFVLVAGPRLVALEASGLLLFSKHVPTLRCREPVLAGEVVVLAGEAALHGYSLGGEERFTIPLEPPAAHEDAPRIAGAGDGSVYALDATGRLRGFDARGQQRLSVPLELGAPRDLLRLPSGRIVAAGAHAGPGAAAVLLSPDGRIEARAELAGPAPIALAAAGTQAVALSLGAEVQLRSAARLELLRTIALRGPARSPANVDADGTVHVHSAGPDGLSLCRARSGEAARCIGLGLGPDTRLSDGPLRLRGGAAAGSVLSRFVADSLLLPRLHGVLAWSPDGAVRRWPLPDGEVGAPRLALDGSGALLAVVPGQPALFVFGD